LIGSHVATACLRVAVDDHVCSRPLGDRGWRTARKHDVQLDLQSKLRLAS